MSAISTISVFIGTPPIVHSELYNAWIGGNTDQQAAWIYASLNPNHGTQQPEPASMTVAQNQFRLFDALEACLHRPRYFMAQQAYYPFPAELKQFLVEKYYAFDEAVARELVGKRLIGKTRRDLDDISVRTFVPLVSCRRQFDNLRRIARRIDESSTDSPLSVAQRKFLIPPSLAHAYVAVIFLNHHQIKVGEPASVGEVPFPALLDCAHLLIKSWSTDGHSLPLDVALFHDIRDVRSFLLTTSKNPADVFMDSLHLEHAHLALPFQSAEGRSLLEQIIGSILALGSALGTGREIRNLFGDLLGSILGPLLRDAHLEPSDLDIFFASLSTLALRHTDELPAQHKMRILNSWQRFLSGLQACCKRLSPEI